jgi:hypothetical protein
MTKGGQMSEQDKPAHTEGPWVVEYDFDDDADGQCYSFPWRIKGVCGFAEEAGSEGDAALIARAPTAPHSCVPSCPGEQNRRKLEAAEEMAEALREAYVQLKRTATLIDEDVLLVVGAIVKAQAALAHYEGR